MKPWEHFSDAERAEMKEQLIRICSEVRAMRHMPSDAANRHMSEAIIGAFDMDQIEVGLCIVYLGQAMRSVGADRVLSWLMAVVAASDMHPTIRWALFPEDER